MAVYFAEDSPILRTLLESVESSSGRAPTAVQQLLSAMVSDNFLISSSNGATSNVASNKIFNVIAHLNALDRGRPYIFLVAHYDTYGIIPALAVGTDSNGSGIAVLLELLTLFSQLYSLPSHEARYNLVFVLSAGGKFSYQGSRSFIDDFNERHSDERIALAICLDSLALGDSLYVHASKTPSDANTLRFIQTLKHFAERPVELITKKINLVSDRLTWEHEIYNIRRIHSVTISHFSNHSDPFRNSLLDIPTSANLVVLEDNTKTIANALVSFVFGLDSQLCNRVKENELRAWMSMFGSKPRPVAEPQQRAHITEISVNDFVLYNIIEDTLTITIVKPAISELILAFVICVYLYALYHFALHAQSLLEGTVIRIRKTLAQ
uniref:BOS complex subunit NCLN n=1 Tax=Globodera rostochiensis TaxID=31243 RepID=A0A914HV22_GLORO